MGEVYREGLQSVEGPTLEEGRSGTRSGREELLQTDLTPST